VSNVAMITSVMVSHLASKSNKKTLYHQSK